MALEGIDALVLAGGKGTRLRDTVPDVPKPLAPVLGRPFLTYLLDMLAMAGCARTVISIGFRAEQIRAALGTIWKGMPLAYCEETRPMGTGGALALALDQLRSERIIVMNGDSVCRIPFAELVLAHRAHGGAGSMAIRTLADTGRYGTIDTDADGRVVRFAEKTGGGAGHINAGIYCLERGILAGRLSANAPSSIERDLFPDLLPLGVRAVPAGEPFVDIGTPESYREAAECLRGLGARETGMFDGMQRGLQGPARLGVGVLIAGPDHPGVLLEHRSDCDLWGLPGGQIEGTESVEHAALREVLEETGLQVRVTGVQGVYSAPRHRILVYPDNGDVRRSIDVALTAEVEGGELRGSAESRDLRWFTPADLVGCELTPSSLEVVRDYFLGRTGVLH